MKKITLQILDMHCTSCAMTIDGELEDKTGIKKSNTNYAKSHTEVEFDNDRISPNQIIAIIKKVGYDAKLIDNS